MWLLEHPDLPTVALPEAQGAPLCAIDLGTSMAPLCLLDFQTALTQPGVNLNFDPITVQLPLPTPTGNTVTLTVDPGIGSLSHASHNGSTWTPAADPTHPQPGEFVFDAVASTVTLTLDRAHAVVPGLPVQLLGGSLPVSPLVVVDAEAPNPEFATDWVDASLFAVFFGLPVFGEVSWTLSAENHPSGSLQLRATADNIELIRERFKVGTELAFAGIGFSVSGYKDKLLNVFQFPALEYDVSVSLGGKWQRKHYNRPVYLSPTAAKQALTVPNAPYLDPDCNFLTASDGTVLVTQTRTTVAALASQNDVPFVGAVPPVTESIEDINTYTLAGTPPPALLQLYYRARSLALGAWDIAIPKDSPRTATGQWESYARELLRLNGTFIDFNSATAVTARTLYAVQSWRYTVAEIDVSCKGDTEFSTDRFGYAFEYPATKLEGGFTEPAGSSGSEDTQGGAQVPGQWLYAPPVRTVLWSGDSDADTCPVDITEIKTMSLNAASSGRTAHRIRTESEGGIEVHREEWTYGLEYNSNEVVDASGAVNASAAGYWRATRYESTEPVIDSGTRYVLGSRSLGYNRAAFRVETDALERQTYDSGDAEYNLYKYDSIPVLAIEGKILAQFAAFYADAAKEAPPFETVKLCNTDGTSSVRYVTDPNYAYPMFAFATRSYRSSFAHTPDPASLQEQPKPDLILGEETDNYTVIQLVPKGGTAGDAFRAGDGEQEGYVEYQSEASSQGQQFGEFSLHRTFADHEGRPSGAQRAASVYKKQQPDDGQFRVSYTRTPSQFEYILCTPGHHPNEPSGGSLGYPRAQFYSQAFLGARTELKWRDIAETADFAFAVPFNGALRPLDKVAVSAALDAYDVRANNISQKVLLQGRLNGYPLVVCREGTQITAGIDREIPFTLTKRLPPKPPIPPTPARKPGAQPAYGLTLGDLGFGVLPNRANFAGKKPPSNDGT